jgi:ParB family chromosome partitioning protein
MATAQHRSNTNGALVKVRQGSLSLYDPDRGLKTIAVADAAEKHWRRAKDVTNLFKAIDKKITAQAEYIVWRDPYIGGRGGKQNRGTAILPEGDPGHSVAERWRKRFCTTTPDGTVIIDKIKIGRAKDDAKHRAQRICEQEKDGTVRGTEGTGEFERYTPAEYIKAAKKVLGAIDLDPASSKIAQRTVKAKRYFTADDDGLAQEWHGRIWLNPPYHRDLAPEFINKLVAEIALGHVKAAIMLTNNSTDTEWFAVAQAVCDALCFTHGRVKFTQENGTEVLPTQGQVFFYFGPDVRGFESVFCRIGWGALPGWKFDRGDAA